MCSTWSRIACGHTNLLDEIEFYKLPVGALNAERRVRQLAVGWNHAIIPSIWLVLARRVAFSTTLTLCLPAQDMLLSSCMNSTVSGKAAALPSPPPPPLPLRLPPPQSSTMPLMP